MRKGSINSLYEQQKMVKVGNRTHCVVVTRDCLSKKQRVFHSSCVASASQVDIVRYFIPRDVSGDVKSLCLSS